MDDLKREDATTIFIFSKRGRTAFLNFARNLSSQIVLLSPCLFLVKLKTFNWSDGISIAAIVTFAGMFLFAVACNIVEFFEAFRSYLETNMTADRRGSGISGWRWRASPRALLSFVFVMLFCYGGFGVVAFMALLASGKAG